jgi:hypothetical protein
MIQKNRKMMRATALWTAAVAAAVVVVLYLFAIPAVAITVEAYRASPAVSTTRRQWLTQILPSSATTTTAAMAAAAATTMAPPPLVVAAADTDKAVVPPTAASPSMMILRSKGCYQGQGDACDELAESNALIQALQLRSAANRDQNERVL